MELRWTEEAANDLERITDYLFEHTPARAADLVREIYDAPMALLAFPQRGRATARRRQLVNSFSRRCHILWSTGLREMSFTLHASCTAHNAGLSHGAPEG